MLERDKRIIKIIEALQNLYGENNKHECVAALGTIKQAIQDESELIYLEKLLITR